MTYCLRFYFGYLVRVAGQYNFANNFLFMKKFLLLLFFVAISLQAQSGLLDALDLDKDGPLDVDKAFVFSAEAYDAKSLLVGWQIAEEHYIYRDKVNFEIIGDDRVQLLPFVLPDGAIKIDDFFGKTAVYDHDFNVLLPLQKSDDVQKITLRVHYQGCSAKFNICYPPVQRDIALSLPSDIAPKVLDDLASQLPQQDRIVQGFAQDNILKILVSFFGLGLLLAFTPCTFPMIPVISSIIVGKGKQITRERAFMLSLVYVLAVSVTYSVAGILTGLLGENIQALLQNVWVIGGFSALIALLALSMFGLFELHLPPLLQHRLHRLNYYHQQGRHLFGAALMGLLSGLIVGPCLTAPLAGVLIFIADQGNPVLGGLALFSLSIGMSLPLLVAGTWFGTLLPRAGHWMHVVKSIVGVLMLALAIWMLERIIPSWIGLLLWGALCIVTSVYLGAFSTVNIHSSSWQKLRKAISLILLIYGSLLVIGGASGSHSVWRPLEAVIAVTDDKKPMALPFIKINSLIDLKAQLSQSNSLIMLDFYADWCMECRKMEATTFRDDRVMKALAHAKILRIDMTDNTDKHKALLNYFRLFGPPALLFFDSHGKEYIRHRWIGGITASRLINHLASLPDKAHPTFD